MSEHTMKIIRNIITLLRKKTTIHTVTDGDGRFLTHFTKELLVDDCKMKPTESVGLQIYDLSIWCR